MEPEDGGQRPKSLEGMSIAEMLLARVDQTLTEEEEDWLMSRDLPKEYGGTGMPNLNLILKKGRRKELKV